MSWLDGPIAAFDVETTGLDVETDRIVSFCVGFQEDGHWHTTNAIVNPGIPIPQTASDVHGITEDRAAKGMAPSAACRKIMIDLRAGWRQGIPIVIFNAPFDLTTLDRELRRHWDYPLAVEGPIIDPLVLDRAVDTYRKGSRRLADVCAHYGVTLTDEDAHTASGDARAALNLARALVREELPEYTLRDLYTLQVDEYRRQRISFNAYLQKQGKTPDDLNTVWPLKPYMDGKVE